MTRKRTLVQGGAMWAGHLYNGTIANNLTALGATQATATQLAEDTSVVTVAALSTGVVIPQAMEPGDSIKVANFGANPVAVYPPLGAKINNAATNAAVALPLNKVIEVTCIDALNFIAVISA